MTYVAAYPESFKAFATEAEARQHAFGFANHSDRPLVVYELVQRSIVSPLPIIQPPRTA